MKNPISSVTKSKRRIVATVFIVGLVVGSSGIAAALTMTDLNTQQISLFQSQTAASDFNIQSYDTNVVGEDSVDVAVTLNNTGTASHAANATVQLLDASGNVLVESTKQTGSVAAGGSYSSTYSFSQTNLATDYDRTFVVVDQTN